MKKHITKILIAVLALVGVTASLAPQVYAAEDPFCNDDLPQAIRESMGCNDTIEQAKTKFDNTIINIINGVLGIIGLVAVVYIIFGGVQYITSAGDTGKLQKAKSTILYALIGLVVVALAAAIVNFVISNVIYYETPPETSQDASGQTAP